MRRIFAPSLLALGALLAFSPAQADWVSPVQGNDTGGIIAYEVAAHQDARQIAVDHCARYGKVAKFLSVDARYGGYISFACRWVPYGSNASPLRTRY